MLRWKRVLDLKFRLIQKDLKFHLIPILIQKYLQEGKKAIHKLILKMFSFLSVYKTNLILEIIKREIKITKKYYVIKY